jgi:hypothetical protein
LAAKAIANNMACPTMTSTTGMRCNAARTINNANLTMFALVVATEQLLEYIRRGKAFP